MANKNPNNRRRVRNVYQDKQKAWSDEFQMHAYSVSKDDVLPFEFMTHYPYYVFVAHNDEFSIGSISFFDRHDKPYFYDEFAPLHSYWYKVDYSRIQIAHLMLNEMCPRQEIRDGIMGYIVPLYETERLKNISDVNAYMRNLHFWESMIESREIVPSDLRLYWMTENRYSEVRDMAEIRTTFNMLSHLGNKAVDPARMHQLRDFFQGDAEEREIAKQRLEQALHMNMGEFMARRDQDDDLKREKEMRKVGLLQELSHLSQQMSNYQDIQQQIEMRKVEITERFRNEMANMLKTSETQSRALMEEMEQLMKRQEQIMKELRENEIQ